MKRLIALMVIALVPVVAYSSDVAVLEPVRTESRAVVSVIELTPDMAQELAKVRNEYRELKARLEAEYESRLNAILTTEPGVRS